MLFNISGQALRLASKIGLLILPSSFYIPIVT